jgi:hypothetical protein
MADRHQIKCVNKSVRYNPWERITHVGGSGWKLSQDEALNGIQTGKWSFFVSVAGKDVAVVVAVSRYGHSYLKTEADNEEPNNLLSLPECV